MPAQRIKAFLPQAYRTASLHFPDPNPIELRLHFGNAVPSD
jgi:hypothetical protein